MGMLLDYTEPCGTQPCSSLKEVLVVLCFHQSSSRSDKQNAVLKSTCKSCGTTGHGCCALTAEHSITHPRILPYSQQGLD